MLVCYIFAFCNLQSSLCRFYPYIILYRIPVPDYLTGLALKVLPLSDKSPLGFSPKPAEHTCLTTQH